jgi:hypothetical protein
MKFVYGVPAGRRRRTEFLPRVERLEDRLAPSVTLSISDPAPFTEPDTGTTDGIFVVTRSGDPAPAVQVDYATQDGTAKAGVDYVATSGTLEFAPNQTQATVAVPIIGNNLYQPDRAFTLVLSNALPSASFAAKAVIGSVLGPATATGDVNLDGKPDIFATSQQGSGLVVFLNKTPTGASAPIFDSGHGFPTGYLPVALAVADLNADGRPDVAVANDNTDTVTVLLNTTSPGSGTPTFGSKEIAVKPFPFGVAIADFNGDGRPDLAVTSQSDDVVSVLLNMTAPGSATPSFAAPQVFAAGSGLRAVTVADFNGDGAPDVIVTTDGAARGGISVLLNQTKPGQTTLSFGSPTSFVSGEQPYAVLARDFNGDGVPDVAVVNHIGNTVSVLINETLPGGATPEFGPAQSFVADDQVSGLAAGDFNGDGRPDLAVAGVTASVLLNTTDAGATTATFHPKQDLGITTGSYRLAVADFNGDGKADLTAGSGNDIAVLLNTHVPVAVSPSFSPPQSYSVGSNANAVALGDVNGDGRFDVAAANGGFDVTVLLNLTPPGGLAARFGREKSFPTGGHLAISVAFADFNGDGRPDLVVGNGNTTTVAVLLNTTAPGALTPSFAPAAMFTVPDSGWWVDVGDFNGDGKPDLAVATFVSATVAVLLNTTPAGSSVASFGAPNTFATSSAADGLAVADFNADGRPDIASANWDDSTVSVLLNTTPYGGATPAFAPQQAFATGSNPTSVAAGDFNGDGRPDLALTNANSASVSVLLNLTPSGGATAVFGSQQSFATAQNPWSVSVGDLNSDGKPDLAVANWISNASFLSILLNATPSGGSVPSFDPPETFASGNDPAGVTVGELNGDGKPDLAVANYGPGKVTVRLNSAVQMSMTGSPATGTILDNDAPVTLNVAPGTSPQSAVVGTAFAVPLAVDVRNAAGTLVQGVSVTFTAPSSGPSGTFRGDLSAMVVSDAAGRATAPTFTANGVAGRYTVAAVAAGGTNPSASFSLANSPGKPAVITAVSGGGQTTGVTQSFEAPLVAWVADAFGNPIPGATVTFAGPGYGAGAVFGGGPTGTTDAGGFVTKAIAANEVAGSYTLTATASGGSNPTTSFVNLTNLPDVPAYLLATAGSNQSTLVNTPFPTNLVATVIDQHGNAVPGVLVTFTAPPNGASATFTGGPTATTNGNGIAVKGITANSVPGTYDISAAATGGNNPTTVFVNLTNLPARAGGAGRHVYPSTRTGQGRHNAGGTEPAHLWTPPLRGRLGEHPVAPGSALSDASASRRPAVPVTEYPRATYPPAAAAAIRLMRARAGEWPVANVFRLLTDPLGDAPR